MEAPIRMGFCASATEAPINKSTTETAASLDLAAFTGPTLQGGTWTFTVAGTVTNLSAPGTASSAGSKPCVPATQDPARASGAWNRPGAGYAGARSLAEHRHCVTAEAGEGPHRG